MTKTNAERLREIDAHPDCQCVLIVHSDGSIEPKHGDNCQLNYLRTQFTELARLAKAYRDDQQLIHNFQHPEIEAELDRFLGEME